MAIWEGEQRVFAVYAQPMKLRTYLSLAVVAFVAATAGADIFAMITIAGETFVVALREHVYWAVVQFVGTMLLLAPFVIVAFLCAYMEEHARTRGAVLTFASAMLTLIYFYFENHQAAQVALLDERWTAATLSIGILPFFIGAPVVLAVLGVSALVAKLDPRNPE
jgi:hypothetical protein